MVGEDRVAASDSSSNSRNSSFDGTTPALSANKNNFGHIKKSSGSFNKTAGTTGFSRRNSMNSSPSTHNTSSVRIAGEVKKLEK